MVEPKILEENVVYQDSWAKVISVKVQFPDGKSTVWTYPDFVDGVGIVPIDSENNVYLVSEWRPAYRRHVVQIPAGACLATDEEGRLKQARNELMEEVGLDANNLEKLCKKVIGGRQKIGFHIYLATDLLESRKKAGEHEYIEVVKMSLDDAIKRFTLEEETT